MLIKEFKNKQPTKEVGCFVDEKMSTKLPVEIKNISAIMVKEVEK